jgi:polar amino acid transport system substrate-binding protein
MLSTLAKILGVVACLLLCLDAGAGTAPHSPTLDAVRKSGVLRVGVKTDFKPFNYLDAHGEVVGFESDVAALVAERLGVRLKKVRITTENRFQKLALGEVDILIATVADTPERRKSGAAVEPGYAETSVNVLFGPGHAVDDWGKIRNRTACAVQGSYFNKPMSERYLLKLQTYKTVRDALLALRDDQCSGFLYATAVLQNTLKLPEWSGYSMPLANAQVKPMSIFIASAERGTELDVVLGDIVAGLHRNGWLLEESRKWGITSNEWLTRQNLLWTEKDAAGGFVCARSAGGLWTASCRSSEYVASTEVGGIQALGLRLKEQLGIDLNFVYDPYDRTQFLRGLGYTMLLIASGIAIALALGTLAATTVDARAGLAPRLLRGFMAYGRLTPPLIMMYLVFFGIGGWTQREFGIRLPAFAVATFCSGYYTAGLVMRALLEAARHIRGFEPAFALRPRTLYRTAHYASWPVKQALINLTKQTMLASAIAIPELLSASSLLIAENGNIFVTMTMLLVTFYLTTRLWTLIIERLENAILSPLAKP